MIHHGQRLALGFETGHDFPRIHADLDNFESDAAFDRLFLLGHINYPKAPFAELLEQLVVTDHGSGAFEWGRRNGHGGRAFYRWPFQEAVVLLVFQQGVDFRAELGIRAARLLKISFTFIGG